MLCCCCFFFLFLFVCGDFYFYFWIFFLCYLKAWEVIHITVPEKRMEPLNYAWFLMCYSYVFLFICIIPLGFLNVSNVEVFALRIKGKRLISVFTISECIHVCIMNKTVHDESCITAIIYSKYRGEITDSFSKG